MKSGEKQFSFNQIINVIDTYDKIHVGVFLV